MTVSISITLDDETRDHLDAAAGSGDRSDVVAQAVREFLDRRSATAASAWHASLAGDDAADFAAFNSAW